MLRTSLKAAASLRTQPSAALALRPSSRSFWQALIGSTPAPTAVETDISKPQAGILQGKGAAPGTVATDYEQATGAERYQLLGNMAGVDVFSLQPLAVDRMGTLHDPIKVPSVFDERMIGCAGFPIDSHDLLWYNVKAGDVTRCLECGCCYELEYTNPWAEVLPGQGLEKGEFQPANGHHDHDEHDHDHGHGHGKAHH